MAPISAEGGNSGTTSAIFGQVARMAGPMVAALLLTRGLGGGIRTMSALSGAQTAGSQYAETYGQLREEGKTHGQAWLATAPFALASGLATAFLTAAGGATGFEAALATKAGTQTAKDAAQGFWKNLLLNVPKHALADIPQELPDELFSQMMSALATNHDADLGKVAADFIKNSPQLIGAIALMGGAGGAMQTQQQFKNGTGQTQMEESGHENPVDETKQPPTAEPSIPDTTTDASPASEKPSKALPGKPSRPPLDVKTSKELITNVEKIQKHRPLNPVEQADLDQARRVVAEDEQQRQAGAAQNAQPSTPPLSVEQSQKLIHNVMNRPPEQRGHPTTQADLAQAQWVVREQVRKLESQTTPLSDAQKKALADAKAALARVAPQTTTSSNTANTHQQSTEERNPYRAPNGTLIIPERSSSSSDPALAEHEKKLLNTANDQPRADKTYNEIPDAKGGKVIGTDIARELLPEFAESREGKIQYTNATGRVAQAYAKDRLWREIENPQGRSKLMFTAGGVASGKSTAVTDEMVAASDLVFDGTLRESDWAIKTIERAIAKGWRVEINYVQRPLPLVLQGAIDRAQSKGRWGSLGDLPAIHHAAQQSILKIAKHFADNPAFALRIWHNDGSTLADPPKKLKLEQIDSGGEYSYDNTHDSGLDRTGTQGKGGNLPADFRQEGAERARRIFEEAVRSGKYELRVLRLLAKGNPELQALVPPADSKNPPK